MPPMIGIPTMSFSQKCHDCPPARASLWASAADRRSPALRSQAHEQPWLGSPNQRKSRGSIPPIEPFLDMAHDALPNRLPELDWNGVADQSSDDLAVDGVDLRHKLIGLREALEARPFAQ